MIVFQLGNLTLIDWILSITLNLIAGVSLGVIVFSSKKGKSKWMARKLIHVVMTTLIAFAVPWFSDLTGILLSAGIFLSWLYGARLFGIDVQGALLNAVTRERGRELETWLSSALGLIVFLLVLVNTIDHIEIFTSAVLSVGWGDGAGEIFGRTIGRKTYKRWGTTKSFEGSIAVALGTFLGIMVSYIIYSPLTLWNLLPIMVIVSIINGGIESVCWSWTDNVFLPIITAILLLIFTI
ncbi:MAG: hypothetical protein ACXACA_08565 [Candidatus Ranarchaeia archaeon]|jgi:dolichol kinase